MALVANERFIATDGTEYNIGETINEKEYSKEYLDAIKKAGMVKVKGAPASQTAAPAAAPAASVSTPAPQTTVSAPQNNAAASQPQEVGTVNSVLPDPTANRQSAEDEGNTGNFQMPVGTVSGDQAANANEPEGGVVGTVSGDQTPAKPETTKPAATKPAATAPKK